MMEAVSSYHNQEATNKMFPWLTRRIYIHLVQEMQQLTGKPQKKLAKREIIINLIISVRLSLVRRMSAINV